ncbi:MAG: hypothetical protein EHM20_16360 [Alphaproteobacteria bacterium]|nr:MAG: hypothetical protein EHM20_16360 [Alphaproteobacteria bacterium]
MSEPVDTGSEAKGEKISDMRENFKKGVFLIAMLFLLVATFQLYFSIEQIINIWFEQQYAPIFRAIYNFLVLLVSLYIIRLYIIKR